MTDRSDPQSPSPHKLGKGMIYGAWILVLGLLTLGFANWLDAARNPNQKVSSTETSGATEVVLEQNRYGHYHATGHINGHLVEFLLDTGATQVSVPGHLAERLGLTRGADMAVSTANGVVITYATRLERVSVGDIELRNVRAHINPAMHSDEVLLGMSFLKQLEFTQRADTLTLRQLHQ